jgi:hypothetical protein
MCTVEVLTNPSLVRRLALLVLPVAALAAAAVALASGPHSEKRRHVRADMALARRILLHQADVGPDWVRVGSVPTSGSSLSCPGFDPDFSRFTITGESSAVYEYKSVDSIVASAEVYPSRAQAAGDFALGARPQFAACLRHVLLRSFASLGGAVKVSGVSAREVSAPRLGEQSAAYRLVAKLAAGGVVFHAYIDVAAFQRGRSQAALVFTGLDSPIPSQLSYARAMATRMR